MSRGLSTQPGQLAEGASSAEAPAPLRVRVVVHVLKVGLVDMLVVMVFLAVRVLVGHIRVLVTGIWVVADLGAMGMSVLMLCRLLGFVVVVQGVGGHVVDVAQGFVDQRGHVRIEEP